MKSEKKERTCPFNLKISQVNQYSFEYNENGNVETEVHSLYEFQSPAKCCGSKCGAWRFGHCTRKS